jgi:hypothetical protein
MVNYYKNNLYYGFVDFGFVVIIYHYVFIIEYFLFHFMFLIFINIF